MNKRLRILIERTADGRWTISYPGIVLPVGVTSPEPVQAERVTKKAAYPVLKRTETDLDQVTVDSLAVRLAAKQPRDGDVKAFGRHLFQVLIGDELWGHLAPARPTTIELSCTDPEFARLPWELMHSPDQFLAQDSIAVVRIAPADHAAAKVIVRPRVLFVIGAELHDARIRAGAEYLGLLKRLECSGLVMESHLLTRATRTSLGDAIRRLKPSIVHFICHGGTESRIGGYLELISEDPASPYDKVPAGQLIQLLDPMPQVVVMNACHSGNASPDTVPLALDVLTSGVPVVIGMSGRVADRACRLFTRGFYKALLDGEPIVQATATARRTGMEHGADPARSVDWAMPVLFLRDNAQVELDRTETDCLRARATRAKFFRALSSPLVLCGRVECLARYAALLDVQAADRPRVLVLKAAEREAAVTNPQYGKTRLLEEMAAIAAVRGHVPCLVTFPKDQAPKTPWQLALVILNVIARTREEFELADPSDYEMLKLANHDTQRADQLNLDPFVASRLKMSLVAAGTPPEELPSAVIRAALMTDLLTLAKDAREARATRDARLVVLIDDVHLCGQAVRSLVETWATPYGLGRKDDPVPLVIAYSALVEEIYKVDVASIADFMEKRPAVFASHVLRAFPNPLDDELPYQQLFLAQEPMLVMGSNVSEERRSNFYQLLHEYMRGVPSRFDARSDNEAVRALIKSAWKFSDVLECADDDAILAQTSAVIAAPLTRVGPDSQRPQLRLPAIALPEGGPGE